MSDRVNHPDPRMNIVEHKKNNGKLFFYLAFFIILMLLLYFAFFSVSESSAITGNVLKDVDEKDLLHVSSIMDAPDNLNIKSSMDKLSLRVKAPFNFYIGDQRFEISEEKTSASIIMSDFKGNLIIDSGIILELDGEASTIFVDGNPISSGSDSMRVYTKENFKYTYLKLTNVGIKSLSYVTSGILKLNQDKMIINLDNESINLHNFQGDLELKSGILKLDGLTEESNVLGALDIRYNS